MHQDIYVSLVHKYENSCGSTTQLLKPQGAYT